MYTVDQIKSIINNVRLAITFCITKKGKTYSSEAEKLISDLGEYSKYCIPELKDEWINEIRKVIYSPRALKVSKTILTEEQKEYIDDIYAEDEEYIIDWLYNFMNAGEIMKKYDETESMEEVEKLLNEQGHSGWSFSGCRNVILKYSIFGPMFVDKFSKESLEESPKLKEEYEKAKAYQKQRKNKKSSITIK